MNKGREYLKIEKKINKLIEMHGEELIIKYIWFNYIERKEDKFEKAREALNRLKMRN